MLTAHNIRPTVSIPKDSKQLPISIMKVFNALVALAALSFAAAVVRLSQKIPVLYKDNISVLS